jgi:DNA-binding response OmpR family regulator
MPMSQAMKSVLIIHPEFYQRSDLEDYLAEHGFRASSCRDLERGLHSLRGQVFDCALVKAAPTLQESLALISQLRQARAEIPVLLLQKQITAQQAELLASLGAVDLLLEPFARSMLLRRLRVLCPAEGGHGLNARAR